MKTREEIEKMLLGEIELRKKDFVLAFKNGKELDKTLDHIRIAKIFTLCEILGGMSYSAVTHNLEKQPEPPKTNEPEPAGTTVTFAYDGNDNSSLSCGSTDINVSETDAEFEQIRTCAVARKSK